MKTLFFFFLGLFTAFSIGCTRKSSNKAMVTLEIPALKNASSKLSSQKVISDGGGNWGGSDPSTIGEVNCWAVFVGGPAASQSKCAVGSGSSVRVFKFNEMEGLVSAGSTLQMEVDAGQRTFYAIGFKSTNGSCPDLNPNSDMDFQNLSNPYVLGEVTQDLKPGDASVNISVTLASDLSTQRLGDCSLMGERSLNALDILGADWGMSSGKAMKIHNGTCARYYLKLDGGVNESARSFSISYGNITTTPGWSIQPAVYMDANCTPGSEASSVTIPAGHNAVELYVKGMGSSWTAGDTGSREVIFTDSEGQIPPYQAMINLRQFSPTSANHWVRLYESTIFSTTNQCREIDLYFTENIAGEDWVVSLGTTRQIAMTNFAGVNIAIPDANSGLFTSSACTAGSGAVTQNAMMGSAFRTLYLKVNTGWQPQDTLIASTTFPAQSDKMRFNVNKIASQMTLTPVSNGPYFASDCVNLNATFQDSNNLNLDIFGNANNPGPPTPKVIQFRGGVHPPSQFYTAAACATAMPQGFYQWPFPTTATGSASTIPFSVIPAVEGYLHLKLDAYPFVRSDFDDEGALEIPIQWDPSQLTSFVLKAWGRATEITSTPSWSAPPRLGQAPFTSMPYNFTSSLPFPLVTPGSTGLVGGDAVWSANLNSFVFQFPAATAAKIHVGYPAIMGDFLVVALIKVTGMSLSQRIFSIVDSGVEKLYVSRGASPIINSGTADSGNYFPPSSWQVMFLQRQGNSSWIQMNNDPTQRAWASSISTSPVNTLVFGNVTPNSSFSGQVGEYMVLDMSSGPPADVHSRIYNYLKAKYPSAGLP
ncbi:MAG: hypothetical protein ACK5P6_08145 [Pseudobdellovibrionaceae bacterium]